MQQKARRTIIGIIVAAQFAVPLVALTMPPPTRFGFQMYSAQGWVQVEVVDDAGTPIDVDLADHVAGLVRAEIDWTDRLAAHLCRQVGGASRVRVVQQDRKKTLTC